MINSDTEIRFSDLLAMLLKASKVILCLVLAFGLIGGAYGIFSALKMQRGETQGNIEAAESRVAIAESNLSGIQNAFSFRRNVMIPRAEQKVDRANLMAAQLREYMDNSIYYGMNPFHRGAARLRFAVETEQADEADTIKGTEDPRVGIVIAYTQMCPFTAETMDHVRKILEIETQTQYLEELISVVNIEDHFVEICFYYDDLQVAGEVVEYLYQTMTALGAEKLQKHCTTVLPVYTGYEVDWEMLENHTANEESMTKSEKDILDAIGTLTELHNETVGEQDLADASNALAAAQSELQRAQKNNGKIEVNLGSVAKRAMKYCILGMAVGFFLGCGCAIVKGLFGGTIQNQNEVIHRYSFPVIGILPRTKKVWFDRAIRKLEGEPPGSFEATAQSLLSRVGERSACMISTDSKAVSEEISAFTDGKVKVIDNIINNAEAIKDLSCFDGVVLVEERGKSRVDLVDAEVMRAKALNKDILGIILA